MDLTSEKWRELHGKMPDIHQDEYTPEELSHLLGVPVEVILHEVSMGDLRAKRAGHHTICIARHDVLNWMKQRGGV